MKRIPYLLLLLIFLPKIGVTQCTSALSSATNYNSNNGQRGCMFDIVATNDITITCFEASLYAGTTADYEIYYKRGTYVGSETDNASWTLAGRAMGITSLGNNVSTPLPIYMNVSILAGETFGFYITNDFGGGLQYTVGTSPDNTLISNTDFSLLGGVGKSYPFGLTFNFREFNGTVNYRTGTSLPVILSSFEVKPSDNTSILSWKTTSEINSYYFSIEHSVDGVTWENLKNMDAVGSPQNYKWIHENPVMGINYYRLGQTDKNGEKEYFKIKKVKFNEGLKEDKLYVYPNPATNIINVVGSKDDLYGIQFLDFYGKSLLDEIAIKTTSEGIQIDLLDLPKGLFILKAGNKSTLVLRK